MVGGFRGRLPAPIRRPLGRVRRWLGRAIGSPIPDGRTIVLDYIPELRTRYGWGHPAHPELERVLETGRTCYEQRLSSFLPFSDDLARIPRAADGTGAPCWDNGYFSGLDAVALYGLLATENPRRLVEVGCGNSTRFARRAVVDHGLRTLIRCIDPQPRVDIGDTCDEFIRSSLADADDAAAFGDVEPGDVVFFDGSHVAHMNSDVVVFFLEVLPRLPSGTLVHVHDIFLPWDYDPAWTQRFYSEQYLLASRLMAPDPGFDVVFPSYFIYRDATLPALLDPLWSAMPDFHWHGGQSFWLRTGGAAAPCIGGRD